MLGLNTIRSLANLMLMSKIDDKPQDLLVIDALMDDSMENVTSQLPLSPILKDALLKNEGIVGEALKCCIAFERADWSNVHVKGLDETLIQKAYFDAVAWSNDALPLLKSA